MEGIMAIDRETTISGLPETAIRALDEAVRGEIVRPGDGGYDQARRVWNAAVDRYPALIVRPLDAADVVQAVTFARANALPLAVRGGGHSAAGHGTVDDGLVVDLSAMKRLDLDSRQRVARVEPGLTWGEFYGGTKAHGLATPGGDVASVGVGGLTLGGGLGWLMRKHGLTIDNLLAVDLVTADGRLVTTSADEEPDLFWALRGGGGNFGIATGFRFRLHPVETVLGGAIVYPATREVLRAFAAATSAAPDELTTISLVLKAPPLPFVPAEAHGTLVLMIAACATGDPAAADRALAPLRALAGGAPLADTTGPLPFPALFDLTANAEVSRPQAIRVAFLRELDDETIETILTYGNQPTSPFSTTVIRELGGAMGRVRQDATAFAHRDKAFYLAIQNSWDDEPGADPERHVAWTEDYWRAIAPRTDGAYVGLLGDEGEERVRAAYPPATYARLAEIKRRYDPDNVFRLNANIHPA
jgi:FAD/FMN-containing dehydrogenase